MPAVGDDRHQLIAIDDIALLIDNHHAVGIAIKRDADVGAHFTHLVDQCFGCGRAAI